MPDAFTAALAAVEAAWTEWLAYDPDQDEKHATLLRHEVSVLCHALRAVRSSGAVVAVVSADTMKLARTLNTPGPIETDEYELAKVRLCARLIDDLAPLLKETP